LSHISSDTLTEQGSAGQANTFYRAQVRFNVTNTNAKLASVAIKPGMTATVDVRTSSRSILEYLAKPVYKAFGGAMNER
jgi:adhesin transport system membrane fusion protein